MTCEIAVAEGKVCRAEPTPRMLEIARRVRALGTLEPMAFEHAKRHFDQRALDDMCYLLRALGVEP